MGKVLGGVGLDVGTTRIRLDVDQTWCDVWEVRRALIAVHDHRHKDAYRCDACLARLEDAEALLRGPFLAGFSIRDSAAFEAWQQAQEQRLVRDHVAVLDLLVDHLAARGEFDLAADRAERRLGLDHLDERTHRRLMLLHAWRGRRADAVRQYRECVAILDRELGVSPLDETTALYQSVLKESAPPAPARPEPATGDAQPPAWARLPLVGRDEELDTARELLGSATAGGRLLVVQGEAGIGKTRLLDETIDLAVRAGYRVVATRCHQGEDGIPYAPIAELLRSAVNQWPQDFSSVARHDLVEAARLAPDVVTDRRKLPTAPPLDSAGAQARFFEGVTRTLAAVVGAGGVVVVDDVHWCDRASADVLAYLLRRLAPRRLFVAVSYRSDDATPPRSLRQAVAATTSEGVGAHLHLQRLDRTGVRTLVRETTGRRGIADRLFDETEGLPFLLAAYLADLENASSPTWELPGTARERLQARLDAVSGVGRQLATAAAVIGRRFDPDTLRATAGRSEDETVAGIDELIARGIVREVIDGAGNAAYDFTHDKLRVLAYEGTSTVRRRLLHGRVVDALTADGVEASQAGVAAHHAERAGRFVEAATLHVAAAEHARALYANREAMVHFRAALGLGHPQLAELHEAIGDLATLDGDYTFALSSFEAAAAHRSHPVDLATLEHKLAGVHLRRGHRDVADAHLAAALELLPGTEGTAQRARVMAERSLAALRTHDVHEARTSAEEALRLATVADDAASLAQAHNVLGALARRRGDLDEAESHLTRSLEMADTLEDPSARAAALNNLGLLRRSTGDVEGAIALHQEALVICRAIGDRHREAAVLNNLADALHIGGHRDEAMHNLKLAVRRFSEVGGQEGPQPEIWKLVEW